MKILQTEIIDKAVEVAGIGKDSDVTTVGVMAVLCIILLAFTIVMYRSKTKKDKEYNAQQLKFLESITTGNIIIKDVQLEVKDSKNGISEIKGILSEMKGYIKGLKSNDK